MSLKVSCFLAICIAIISCGQRSGEDSPALPRKHPNLTPLPAPPPKPIMTKYTIFPKNQIPPYEQWMPNNGYCGEVSLIQSEMFSGMWMSQFNARLICGAGLSQSGPDGFCAAHAQNPDYNAQFLFEDPNPGDQVFASAAVCLQNAHLSATRFDYQHESSGMDGYKEFMTWIKSRVIAGDTVAIGVLDKGEDDPQYDHEVTVTKIGTNHAPTDLTYYEDDVLFFDGHGDSGLSYTTGFTFASLARSRQDANASGANIYSILIPGGALIHSGTGGDGVHVNTHAITPTNYGFAVAGPIDPDGELLPVALSIIESSSGGVPNKPKNIVGINFESPAIGAKQGSQCTNTPPDWMAVSLQVTVTDLTPGIKYNLYEYDFSQVTGVGSEASLKIPDTGLNAHASQATHKTQFTATSSIYQQSINTTSDKVIAVRCVRADAP